ncbi:MAG: STAS domain-containing protein [Magnetococcales bacterium]|nr:STAS domain-containing protein [Magnetococcales bacterium]
MGVLVREVREGASSGTLIIELSGKFDYQVNREFHGAFKNLDNLPALPVVVDCSAVEHIDSAALGMLLMLREQAGGNASKVTICGCNANLKKIFAAAHFDRLFKFA